VRQGGGGGGGGGGGAGGEGVTRYRRDRRRRRRARNTTTSTPGTQDRPWPGEAGSANPYTDDAPMRCRFRTLMTHLPVMTADVSSIWLLPSRAGCSSPVRRPLVGHARALLKAGRLAHHRLRSRPRRPWPHARENAAPGRPRRLLHADYRAIRRGVSRARQIALVTARLADLRLFLVQFDAPGRCFSSCPTSRWSMRMDPAPTNRRRSGRAIRRA